MGPYMTWRTQAGTRILKGAEAALYREMMATMADELVMEMDYEFEPAPSGIRIFDQLPAIARLALLAEVSTALLRETDQVPQLRAINESVIGALFVALRANIDYEIDTSEDSEDPTFWRSRILAAFLELGDAENILDVNSDDSGEWDILIQVLTDQILWDWDFGNDDLFLDKSPEHAGMMKDMLAIDDDYFTAIPPDPNENDRNRLRSIIGVLYSTDA